MDDIAKNSLSWYSAPVAQHDVGRVRGVYHGRAQRLSKHGGSKGVCIKRGWQAMRADSRSCKKEGQGAATTCSFGRYCHIMLDGMTGVEMASNGNHG